MYWSMLSLCWSTLRCADVSTPATSTWIISGDCETNTRPVDLDDLECDITHFLSTSANTERLSLGQLKSRSFRIISQAFIHDYFKWGIWKHNEMNVLKHGESFIKFRIVPVAVTQYLVRACVCGSGVEKGRPQFFQLSSMAVKGRQGWSVISITDRTRIMKPPISSSRNVSPTRMKTIRLNSTSTMWPPTPTLLSFRAWGRNYSCLSVEQFKRRSKQETSWVML